VAKVSTKSAALAAVIKVEKVMAFFIKTSTIDWRFGRRTLSIVCMKPLLVMNSLPTLASLILKPE